MCKKRSITMYNMIFPVFLIFSPISAIFLPFMEPLFALLWLLVIVGGNLVLDWLVTALAMRWQKVPEVRKKSLAVLVRVWLAGYAADILSALLIILCFILFGEISWFSDNIEDYFYNSIYQSTYAVAFTLAMIFVSGCLIYRFNVNWALEEANLTEPQCKRVALALAVLTAPWLFLLPANMFYV